MVGTVYASDPHFTYFAGLGYHPSQFARFCDKGEFLSKQPVWDLNRSLILHISFGGGGITALFLAPSSYSLCNLLKSKPFN